jgi:hypothetical protein
VYMGQIIFILEVTLWGILRSTLNLKLKAKIMSETLSVAHDGLVWCLVRGCVSDDDIVKLRAAGLA